ncbi:MAG: chloride channel protein [Polyangiaceae bacterium]
MDTHPSRKHEPTLHPSQAIAPIHLSDFTANRRTVFIAALAMAIGALATWVAWALLRLIALFTNLFYFGRWSVAAVSPATHQLGWAAAGVPVLGAICIGLLARYGSERIRGHGIPEALEAILTRGSRVEPKVALLKPVSAAISIGSGGPFGAEGPIIMTGGAFGSIIAQLFSLTAAERKTLLVAGAAAGMSATFATPLAAILLAVELLLFEWKPRSFVPVALASATAAVARHFVLGAGPLFPMAPHPEFAGVSVLACCAVAGLAAGLLSGLLTGAVYLFEDLFKRLPIHWMWWPAIGGAVIGLGGLVCPSALGVGYDVIGTLLADDMALRAVLVLMLVKAMIWSVALGSGTSGGVLAPLLMMGGALGALEAHLFPSAGVGFWALVSMGAILGGTMRSPLTGIVFSIELTRDLNMLLPLVIAVSVAHVFTVLVLRRSILTEKVARRGFHVSREYAIDVLEVLFVRDVMNRDVTAIRADLTVHDAASQVGPARNSNRQSPVALLDAEGHLTGAIDPIELSASAGDSSRRSAPVATLSKGAPLVVYANETLRLAVQRMAEAGVTHLWVANPADARHLVGGVSLADMLSARLRHLDEERRRERILPWDFILPAPLRPRRASMPSVPE